MRFITFALAAFLAINASAQTNDLAISYYRGPALDEELPKPDDSFLGNVSIRIERDGNSLIVGRFGTMANFSWFMAGSFQRYGIHGAVNSAGRNAVKDMFVNSLRDTMTDGPTDRLLDEATGVWDRLFSHTFFGPFISGLINGTVGNTREMQDAMVSAAPTEESVERAVSRWQQIKTANHLEYGLRDTYAYLRAQIGHNAGGLPIVDLDVRCIADFPNGIDARALWRFGRIEGRATIPLPGHCDLVAGLRLYPGELMSSKACDFSASILLQHIVFGIHDGHRRPNGYVYIGAFTNTSATTGITSNFFTAGCQLAF